MANVKISELSEALSVTPDDLFVIVDDPSGSPVTKKVSLATLSASMTTVVSLGSVSGTINTDASTGDIFDLTITASGTIANPTNGVNGQTLRWRIKHNANSITINLGNNFDIPSSASSPLPFSTASGVIDLLAATYDSNRTKWDVIAFVPGY